MFKYMSLLLLSWSICLAANSQATTWAPSVTPRVRVIIDNDFGGDPDGLFQLAHILLSPSVDVRGVIGSHLNANDGFDKSGIQAEKAAAKAKELIQLIPGKGSIPVLAGSNIAMANDSTPVKDAAVDLIIREASRTDSPLPLYVVCGAGLTEIASALLTAPQIAGKLTLIWIGGPEYSDLALPPPNYSNVEYNLNIDLFAARAVFNRTTVAIWQVPRNVYRQCIYPYASLVLKVKPLGLLGAYLVQQIEQVMKTASQFHFDLGETYILGDSPLVLLTALQSNFEPDPSSSDYVVKLAPLLNEHGAYDYNAKGRPIRVYTHVDTRLMFDDLLAKLELANRSSH